MKSAAARQPSAEARRLLAAQHKALPRILKKVEDDGPSKFRKTDHWAWYVWPTTKVGFSDPNETACVDANDVACVLGLRARSGSL